MKLGLNDSKKIDSMPQVSERAPEMLPFVADEISPDSRIEKSIPFVTISSRESQVSFNGNFPMGGGGWILLLFQGL